MPKIIVVVSSRIFFTKIRYQMGAGLKPDGTESGFEIFFSIVEKRVDGG